MRTFENLSGRQFGIYKVIGFDHMQQYGTNGRHGMSYYRCKCVKCGYVAIVSRSQLMQCKNGFHRNGSLKGGESR